MSGLDRELIEALERSSLGLATDELPGAAKARSAALDRLRDSGAIHGYAGWWMLPQQREDSSRRLIEALGAAHLAKKSLPLVDLAVLARVAELPLDAKALDRLAASLAQEGAIRKVGNGVALADFAPKLNPRQARLMEALEEFAQRDLKALPTTRDTALALNCPVQAIDSVLQLGRECGRLFVMDEGRWTSLRALRAILQAASLPKRFDVADLRNATGMSRRDAGHCLTALLEAQFAFKRNEDEFELSELARNSTP